MNLWIFLRIVHEKIEKVENYNTVSHICFFATLNKEQKSSYLQLCRRLNGKILVLGFLYSKSTPPIVQQKMRKDQHVKRSRFSLNTNKSTLKIIHSKSLVHGHDQVFVLSPIQNSPFSIQ